MKYLTDFYLSSKEIDISTIGLILLVPYFEPAAIVHILPQVSRVLAFTRYIFSLLIILWYILYLGSNKRLPKAPVVLTFLLFSMFFVSNLINGKDKNTAISYMLNYTALTALCEMIIDHSYKSFVRSVSPILNVLVICNFITMLLFPNGMYVNLVPITLQTYTENWLLGYDNTAIIVILPAILFAVVRAWYIDEKYSLISTVILVISVVSIVRSWVATTLVSISIFILVYILIKSGGEVQRIGAIINSMIYLIATIAAFLVLSVFQLTDLYSSFVEKVMRKNITFSGRIRIWGMSIASTLRKWQIGYGFDEMDGLERLRNTGLSSTHNTYLWFFYIGGIIAFITFIVYIVLISKRMYKYRYHKITILSSTALFGFYIMWLMEAIYSLPEFAFICAMYYITDEEVMDELISSFQQPELLLRIRIFPGRD